MPYFQVDAYDLSKEGSLHLSKNFQVKEFACKDLSNIVFIQQFLVEILQDVRDHFGSPVTINSGYRTANHNKKVGGSEHSMHLVGCAADIVVKGVSPVIVYDYLNSEYPGILGLGLYSTFTHVDTRINQSRWRG